MFIRRSEYKALLESRDNWKALALKGVSISESLLMNNKKLIEICKALMERSKNGK